MSALPGGLTPLAPFVTSHPEMNPELPVVHSTLVEHFRSVAAAGFLTPRGCPVFGEPLVYLFYGRPAYRSSRGGHPETNIQYCPICFIFKTSFLVEQPARIYPFDTGAAMSGRFQPHIDPADTGAFQLAPMLASVLKFTNLFFDANEHYFLGTPKRDPVIPLTETAAIRYHAFVTHGGPETYDDRRSAIELQYRDPIPLKGMLWAVAMPTSFLEDPVIRKTVVGEWGAFPLTYNIVRGTAPGEYSSVIRALYERWLREGRFL